MTTLEVKAHLKASITQKPPFCTGTIPLSPEHAGLFYKNGTEANWIDMSQPSDRDLELLTKACDPATFGVDQRDVLDETYRKAGKMDTVNFAAKFDLGEARLIERLRVQLLSGFEETKPIRAELYKLNVYGKDSFFKAHKDTPRSETMFGSLVVVYPTRHEGGALLLRHGGKEWSFDSAEAVRNHDGPAIAYVAFYSDVEHEVAVVQSGYRVTLTYNLYFEGNDHLPPLSPTVAPVAPDDHAFESALVAALKNPEFLSVGGTLGFGLAFTYPVSPNTVLKNLLECLKGSDAVIKQVCDRLSLDVSLRAIYRDNTGESSHTFMINQIVDLGDEMIDTMMTYVLRSPEWGFKGKVIHDYGTKAPKEDDGKRVKNAREVLWVTPLTQYAHHESSYIAYGNDASVQHIYGNVCLVVNVGPPDQRETKKSGPPNKQGVYPSTDDEFDPEGEDGSSSSDSEGEDSSTDERETKRFGASSEQGAGSPTNDECELEGENTSTDEDYVPEERSTEYEGSSSSDEESNPEAEDTDTDSLMEAIASSARGR